MATFVFVPGGFHGAWCWDLVVERLEQRGHEALAIDLPGAAGGPSMERPVTLADWTSYVVAECEDLAESVVLVAHSRGGLVISQVAEVLGPRVQAVVFVTALMLRDGEGWADVAAAAAGERSFADAVDVSPDRRFLYARPEKAGEVYYNTTPPELAASAIARLGPEPMGPAGEPVRITQERFGAVPRFYLECLEDQALPLSAQRRMQAAMPCAVFTLPTDHSPFFSAPSLLTDLLEQTAMASDLSASSERGISEGDRP